MTAAVVDNLPLLAIAPGGVSQLRELILDLAANGRLGSANVDWRATQLRELVVSSGAGWSPSCDARPRCGDEWGVLKVSAVSWGQFLPDENKALPRSLAPRRELEVQPGDFLVSRANTADLVARSVVVDDTPPKLMLSDKIVRLRLSEACDPRFVQIANSAPESRRYYARVAGGTSSSMKNVSREQILALPILLPPLVEQHRVVAKVDELMALCDRLEARQQDAEAAHARLVQALLDSLTQARDAEEFQACWQRLALCFESVLTNGESVEAFEAAVFDLAARGVLTRRESDDEPATLLLSDIAEHKTALSRRGLMRDAKSRPPIGGPVPFDLPNTWCWARWDDVALKIGDIDHKMPEPDPNGVPFVSPRDFYPGNVIDFEGAKRVARADYERLSSKIRAERGDLIYPRYGTIGENVLVTVDREFLVSYSCAVIKVARGFVEPEYQFLVSLSGCIRRQAKAAENKTTQANVGIKSIQEFLFPLPPLAEQRRIVAKVTELLALCDQLKARIAAARAKHAQLAEALVAQAVAA